MDSVRFKPIVAKSFDGWITLNFQVFLFGSELFMPEASAWGRCAHGINRKTNATVARRTGSCSPSIWARKSLFRDNPSDQSCSASRLCLDISSMYRPDDEAVEQNRKDLYQPTNSTKSLTSPGEATPRQFQVIVGCLCSLPLWPRWAWFWWRLLCCARVHLYMHHVERQREAKVRFLHHPDPSLQ